MTAVASGWLSRRPRARASPGDVRRDVDEQAFLLVRGEEHGRLLGRGRGGATLAGPVCRARLVRAAGV